MHRQPLEYHVNGESFLGHVAHSQSGTEKGPGVLIVPDWCGCDEFVQQKAESLAESGYVGFAVDVYGDGVVGKDDDEKGRLAERLLHDRQRLQDIMLGALSALQSLDQVNSDRIAAIGYCTGGLCVLDLARSGADVKGVCGFHSILSPPEGLAKQAIMAKILALQGFNDPFVPLEQITAFTQEMVEAETDWQLHIYGQARHSYTKQKRPGQGEGIIYNEEADRRSWRQMIEFLNEIL